MRTWRSLFSGADLADITGTCGKLHAARELILHFKEFPPQLAFHFPFNIDHFFSVAICSECNAVAYDAQLFVAVPYFHRVKVIRRA